MKLPVLLLAIFILRVHAAAQPGSDSHVTFRFCYEEKSLPPFFLGQGLVIPDKRPGVMIEMLRQLDRTLSGLTVHYSRAPWSRCMEKLKLGHFDGVIANFSPKRLLYGIYPMKNNGPDRQRAMSLASYCLYYTDSSVRWNGKAFSGNYRLPIAVPRGYSITDFLSQHQQAYLEVNSTQQAFKVLNHHRVSAAVTLCEVGDSLLNSHMNQYQTIQRNPDTLVEQSGYLLVSKQFYQQYPDTVQTILVHLAKLKEQELRKLLHYDAAK